MDVPSAMDVLMTPTIMTPIIITLTDYPKPLTCAYRVVFRVLSFVFFFPAFLQVGFKTSPPLSLAACFAPFSTKAGFSCIFISFSGER